MDRDSEKVRKEPGKVEGMFDGMAPLYDFANHFFSFGLDFYWRKKAVKALAPDVSGPILDGATGTGDVAIALAGQYPDRKIVGVDFSTGMLELGVKKIARRGLADRIKMDQGDLTRLPYDDDMFAGATVAFGVRNVEDRKAALSEFARVLKPGGRLLILEFAMPTTPIFGSTYRLYFKYFMPAVASLFGLGPTYRYLFQSVDAFPSVEGFKNRILDAGFESVETIPMTLGTVIIYLGVRK